MKMLRLVGRTVRRMVWETAMEQHHRFGCADGLSTSFHSRPRPLFLWHLLGFVRDRSSQIASHVCHPERILPPDPKVQDILDSALASVVVTGSSGWIANVGIIAGFISAPCLSARFRAPSVIRRRGRGPALVVENTSFFFSCLFCSV